MTPGLQPVAKVRFLSAPARSLAVMAGVAAENKRLGDSMAGRRPTTRGGGPCDDRADLISRRDFDFADDFTIGGVE